MTLFLRTTDDDLICVILAAMLAAGFLTGLEHHQARLMMHTYVLPLGMLAMIAMALIFFGALARRRGGILNCCRVAFLAALAALAGAGLGECVVRVWLWV